MVLFCCSIVLALTIRCPVRLALVFLWHAPFFVFWASFNFLDLQHTPGSFCIFCVPTLEWAVLLGALVPFTGQWYSKPPSGHWCACCYWHIITFKPFSRQLGNIFMYYNLFVYTCLHFCIYSPISMLKLNMSSYWCLDSNLVPYGSF